MSAFLRRVVLVLLTMFIFCHLFLKIYRTNVVEMTEKSFVDVEDDQRFNEPLDKKPEVLVDRTEAVTDLELDEEEMDGTEEDFSSEAPIEYHGHDLMEDPPFKFDPNFKNPCWFEDERLRCLPYMFIIGVKKCGTSDLFFRTALHPDFVKPGFKEAQFFARKRFKTPQNDDINEYVKMFDFAASEIFHQANYTGDKLQNLHHITGEGSPSNLHLNTHWKYLPGNENLDEPKYVILDYIHHFLPKAKIMITFRDPVDRLYSDYYHEYGSLMKNNNPNPQEFHDVVSRGVSMYEKCFKDHTIRSCIYNPDIYADTKIQMQLGVYYIFWEELLRLFPREQILVLQNKNLHDKEATMRRVHEFLELRRLNDLEMERVVNAQEHYTRRASFKSQGPMFNETLKILRDFYRPFNKRMAEITGDSDFYYGYGEE